MRRSSYGRPRRVSETSFMSGSLDLTVNSLERTGGARPATVSDPPGRGGCGCGCPGRACRLGDDDSPMPPVAWGWGWGGRAMPGPEARTRAEHSQTPWGRVMLWCAVLACIQTGSCV
jgi:hypothetical protein